MINNFVCCCDCEYQEICNNYDAYGGCKNGKVKEIFVSISLNNRYEDIAKLNDN